MLNKNASFFCFSIFFFAGKSHEFRLNYANINQNYIYIVNFNDSVVNLFPDSNGFIIKEKKIYNRWKYFWDTRLDRAGIEGGNFSIWASSIKNDANQICHLNVAWDCVGHGNSTQDWVCFNQGLPVCIVTDLEINYKQNKIYAATFGRGVWKSDLFCPSDYDLNFSSPSINLSNTFKEAQNNITLTSTSGVWSVQDFTARAGNEISISAQPAAGFVLNTNSHLFIHPCNSPGNSFRTNAALHQNQTNSVTSSFAPKNKSEYFSSVKLYPNPFNDEITIESDSEWLKYEIYHAHGLKLKEGTLTHSKKMQTASFKPGIYLIRITDNRSSSYTFKMIKQ